MVCYNISNTLTGYYKCSNTNNINIHGLCEECYQSIINTKHIVCPICRNLPLN
jgi:hypothetical protein